MAATKYRSLSATQTLPRQGFGEIPMFGTFCFEDSNKFPEAIYIVGETGEDHIDCSFSVKISL